jgi:hypothetical protein
VCRCRTPGSLAAVWVAFLVVAAFGLMSCTREVSGSPVKSNAMFSVDLGTVLLDADEIDDVMGTSGSEVLDEETRLTTRSKRTRQNATGWSTSLAKSNTRPQISPRCVGGS